MGAYLRPPVAGEKTVVLGAHFDHIGTGAFASLGGKGEIHNGADDNASGVAVMLEVARKLANEKRPTGANVLFLGFDAEERGLYGSKAFIESEYFRQREIAAMINLDMVGRLRSDFGLGVQGSDTSDERWEEAIRRSFRESGFSEDIPLSLLPGGEGPSDHAAFFRRKIPVAFVFTGTHERYHTPQDDWETLDMGGLAAVARFTRRLILNAARTPSLPFREPGRKARRSDFK